MMTAVEAQARAISSRASAYETVSMPAPPHSSGTATPIRPSSPSRAISSLGKRCSLSIAAARGAISLLARSRAVSRSRVCSGVSSRSTISIIIDAPALQGGWGAMRLRPGLVASSRVWWRGRPGRISCRRARPRASRGCPRRSRSGWRSGRRRCCPPAACARCGAAGRWSGSRASPSARRSCLASLPLRGPLFTTATVGASVLISTGLLLWSRPWWLIWNTSIGPPTRFFGQTSAPSVFQVRSPPSKNRNGPKLTRRDDAVAVVAAVRDPWAWCSLHRAALALLPLALTNFSFMPRNCSVSLAAPGACFSGSVSPGLMRTRLSTLAAW